ncbi:MAG: ABC transporter permease [Clostridia bacterium]|nr:ABC transporter permease [Clostridia bacterium]
MIRFALKNMAIKKVQIILVVISIILSAGIAVLAFNVSNQVSDGISKNAQYYSVIVGPSGSKTQLAMNSMYFSDAPLGTIPYSVVTELSQDNNVREAVPFAMADNYNGSSVVGTTPTYLKDKELSSGEMFKEHGSFEAVIGYRVAKENGLKVGDTLYTSHSATGGQTHEKGLTVVGILERTYSSFDTVVFTQIRSLWDLHDHGEEHESENEHASESHDSHQGEEAHNHSKTVCAVLVRAKNPSVAMSIIEKYNGKVIEGDGENPISLQAISPMDAVRDVLNDADNTKYIVFVLCAVILIMNIMIISIITLLNMYHSSKEISLMRLIGISMKKINLLYLIQNSIIGLFSTILAFGLSRICLALMNDYVSSMGVVLNIGRIYPLEIIILVGVFVISVLPTAIWTFVMSKKDSINS